MTDAPPVKSPCISNCCLNTDDVCLGCFRHLDEITSWNSYDNGDRILVLKLAELRKQHYTKSLSKRSEIGIESETRFDC